MKIGEDYLPPDHTLGFTAEMDVTGNLQVILPLDDFLVGLMRTLRAERRITFVAVPMSARATTALRCRSAATYRQDTHT
jgi:hypothetical protein